MQTPWVNKRKMEEIIFKLTNTCMRFPIKPIVLEYMKEIEADIESSKLKKNSKQTGDSKNNKDRKKKNKPVKDENRNYTIQEAKINQNDGVVNAKPNKPASTKKKFKVPKVKRSSFHKRSSKKAKGIDPNRETNFQAKSNDRMNFTISANNKIDLSTSAKNENKAADLKQNLKTEPKLDDINEKMLINPIVEYTSIQEYEPMFTDEDHMPSSEENVMKAIEEDSATSHQIRVAAEVVFEENPSNDDNEPASTDEEQTPSSEGNVITAMEEDPSLFQYSKVTEDATFVENPPNKTIVEMGYDQTNPLLSEKSGQEHTFLVDTVGGKEAGLIIPVSSDKANTSIEDQEFQKKSNDHKEEQFPISIELFGINDLKKNNMITTTDLLNAQIPVILGKYNIEICLEDEEIFADKVKEIREISKKVELTTCKFIPSELSPSLDNGSSIALKGNLTIEGIIKQDIKYIYENKQTSNYEQNQSAFKQMNQKNTMYLRKLNFGKYTYVPQPPPANNPNLAFEQQTNHVQYTERLINSMSKTIPFSSVVEINNFLHPPLFGSIEEKSFTFQNNLDQQKSNADTIQFVTTAYYPANTYGKLIYSKIHDNINFFEHKEKYIKTPRIKLKQFIVLELWIHLLQEQSVQIQTPKNGFNLSPSY